MTKRVALSIVISIVVVLFVIAVIASWPRATPAVSTKTKSTAPSYLISLGDSVAAGDGLPLSNDIGWSAACAQSNEAYPNIVAQQLHLKLLQLACSGAKTTNGILYPQTASNQTVPSQLDTARPYIRGNDVVITVGANDVDWGDMLLECAKNNCISTANLTLYQQNLAKLQTNLTQVLRTINSYHPHTVVLNTYYSLLANTDTCLEQYDISSASIAWVNAREATLNNTIAMIAEKAGAKSVPINFAGHMLCGQDSWIQNLSDNAPLHPTQAGQRQIAKEDLSVL